MLMAQICLCFQIPYFASLTVELGASGPGASSLGTALYNAGVTPYFNNVYIEIICSFENMDSPGRQLVPPIGRHYFFFRLALIGALFFQMNRTCNTIFS